MQVYVIMIQYICYSSSTRPFLPSKMSKVVMLLTCIFGNQYHNETSLRQDSTNCYSSVLLFSS